MKTIEPRLLKGFRDYLPQQMIARQRMMGTIAEVFERYGFSPLQTPALEHSDILLGKCGADAEKLFYRFTDHGGRDVCLRYDLTVPLARVAAQYGDLPLPFKRYQIAPVWRAEKPGKGRFREFFQCDVDIVGTSSLVADAECVAVDNDVLSALGVDDFTINVNNRRILTGLLDALDLGLDGKARQGVLRTIDKLGAMGQEGVRGLLVTEDLVPANAVERIIDFLAIEGTNEEKLAAAEGQIGGSQAGARGIGELRDVVTYATRLGVPAHRIQVDLSIARGLDYYTGTVFETFLLGLPGFGSVMSGGRYDDLIGTFLGRDMPAVGISAGIDRLFSGMIELGLVEAPKTPTRVLVTSLAEDVLPQALSTAAALRRAGLQTEVYLQAARLRKQLKYANQQGIEAVVIVGPDEVAAGELTIKLMQTREQLRVPLEGVAQKMSSLLA